MMTTALSPSDIHWLIQAARVYRAGLEPKNSRFGYVYFQKEGLEWVPRGWKEQVSEPRSFVPGLLFVGEQDIFKSVGGNDQDGAIDFVHCATLQADTNQ